MKIALNLAREAADDGEIPVGCVVVNADGEVIGRGRNRCETARTAAAHAELEAIAQAGETHGDWRLDGCRLYVTLEPCAMCAGAIINARISRVFYGAREPNLGACGSVINLFMEYPNRAELVGGILESACKEVLERFFKKVRDRGTV
jgi:tRNA(adenine34) deaminase